MSAEPDVEIPYVPFFKKKNNLKTKKKRQEVTNQSNQRLGVQISPGPKFRIEDSPSTAQLAAHVLPSGQMLVSQVFPTAISAKNQDIEDVETKPV